MNSSEAKGEDQSAKKTLIYPEPDQDLGNVR